MRISGLVLALLLWAMPSAAAVDRWSQEMSAEAARQDLAALYTGLKEAHYDLFANLPEQEYDRAYEAAMAAFNGPISRYELAIALQKFVALGDIAHARIDFPREVYSQFRADGGRGFPIYLRIIDGRAYVGENLSGLETISTGDEILAIDGIAMSRWLDRTAQHLSADTPYMTHSLLEFFFPMYLWVETGEQEAFELEVRSQGDVQTITVPALSADDLALNADTAPETFELDFTSRQARMLTPRIAYLRPGPFYNAENPEDPWNTTAYVTFIDGAFANFNDADAEALVIDLRNNSGGDKSFSDPIIEWMADKPFNFASRFSVRSSDQAAAANQARLDAAGTTVPETARLYAKAYAKTPRGERFDFEIPAAQPHKSRRFEGDVYVLVNRTSFSNAVTTAATFQDNGWATIAGEKTSDFATTYGAMESFTLPRSELVVGFPKALIIRPSGDTRPGGVIPDMPIETPLVPSETDVVLGDLVSKIEDQMAKP